jgi:hypothetical protein
MRQYRFATAVRSPVAEWLGSCAKAAPMAGCGHSRAGGVVETGDQADGERSQKHSMIVSPPRRSVPGVGDHEPDGTLSRPWQSLRYIPNCHCLQKVADKNPVISIVFSTCPDFLEMHALVDFVYLTPQWRSFRASSAPGRS